MKKYINLEPNTRFTDLIIWLQNDIYIVYIYTFDIRTINMNSLVLNDSRRRGNFFILEVFGFSFKRINCREYIFHTKSKHLLFLNIICRIVAEIT